MLAFLLLASTIAQETPQVVGLRPLLVELYRSGLIKVAGQPVPLARLAKRIRAHRRNAEVLCVWHEPRVAKTGPAYDIYQPAEVERLNRDMRTIGILAEMSRSFPSFDDRDEICRVRQTSASGSQP